MPVRKLNYTDRIRIPESKVQAKILPSEAAFEVDLSVIETLNFPSQAFVIVEPYWRQQRLRISYGTIGKLTEPSIAKRNIGVFENPENVSLRIKIVDPKSGKILGEASNVSLVERGKKSLLPVAPVDIAPECWRVVFDDDKPVLEVDKNIGDWRQLVNSKEFRAFVYPAVVREILTYILCVRENYDVDDGSDFANWLKFGEHYAGKLSDATEGDNSNSSDKEEIKLWIDQVIGGFARQCDAHQVAVECFAGDS